MSGTNIDKEAVSGVRLEIGTPSSRALSFQNRKKQIGSFKPLLRPNSAGLVIQLSENRQRPTWEIHRMTKSENLIDHKTTSQRPQKDRTVHFRRLGLRMYDAQYVASRVWPVLR